MAKLHGTIDIEAPVSLAYSQWLQLEQLPDCMPGLRVVLELDQEHSYWIAESWGRRKEWFAQTVRQIPDQYIAWRSDDGLPIAGSVSFINLGPRQTRVSVQVEYQPEGKLEKIGSLFKVQSRLLRRALEGFRQYVEALSARTDQPVIAEPQGVSGSDTYRVKPAM